MADGRLLSSPDMTETLNPPEHELASYRARLCRYFAVRRCGDVAEDLASDVTARVFEALRRGEVILNLGAYCLGTARLVFLEHIRSKGREPDAFPDGWEPPAPEPIELDEERVEILRGCLGALASKDRELVLAYYGDGQGKSNRARIAEGLGVSLNAVHIRACRLRAQVRQCVESGQPARPRPR